MNDSSSLQNLNDIVLPATVGWWPLASGWYVIATLVPLITLWYAWRWWRQRQTVRYRRLALATLHGLLAESDGRALRQVPELLKRAALSCWPRTEVAALSGRPWHEFLDRSSGSDCFCAGVGPLLDRLAYLDPVELDEQESDAVFTAAKFWLKKHRRERVRFDPC